MADGTLELLPGGNVSPIGSADQLRAAFLAGHTASTREAYARDLRAWGDFLAGLGVEVLDAHRAHVDVWVRQAEKRLAAATIARRLSAIGGFYGYALEEELIHRSPVARVRRPRVSDESPRLGVDRDAQRALLAAAQASGARDHALVALLVLSGLRISETLAADVEDLDVQRGHHTIRLVRKGTREQTVALASRVVGALDELLEGRASGPIFVTRSGRRLDRQAAHKTVTRLARAAGIKHAVSPHSLRHGFVTTALDAGASLRDVQDAAGHADPRTTRRYDRGRGALDRSAAVTGAVASFVEAS